MRNQYTLDDVKTALNLPDFDAVAAQRKMAPITRPVRRPDSQPGQPRLGGVLVLLYCYQQELYLVLTRRREDLNNHAGQISFPGGRHEEDETLQETAVREAQEEIGVDPAVITILGELTPLYIPPSDFEVHPTVAWYANGQRPVFYPSDAEVAEVLEVPLSHLLQPETRIEELWNWRGSDVAVPFFNVEGHKVWGATAMMLSELVERLRIVGEE
ncbi:MAG: CoA pyrophosphatase [Ardenticatenaceae bacterium]|nr:CoA pyrophosphatase [Ardenticatenaceae bacterium]MCB9442857.1 CoA pyrophosphatase [Ardenticatenaceae bacterium]